MNGEMIKEFLVGLGFQVDEKGLSEFTQGIASTTTRVMAFGAAITATAAGVLYSIQQIAKSYNELDLLATRLKTTTEALDDFLDIASIMGIGEDKAKESLLGLNSAIQDTALGIGRAKMVFEKLGVSVKDAQGNIKSTTDVMAELQVKMKDMDRAQQIRVMERLGLDPALVRMFNRDLTQLKKDLDDIDKSTGFDLKEAVSQSKAFTTSWRLLKEQIELVRMFFSKLYESMAVKMMPKIREGIIKVTESIKEFRNYLMQNAGQIMAFLEPLINIVMKIAGAFVTLALRAGQVLISLVSWIMDLNNATNGWIGYLGAALLAWKAFNLGFLATPIGAIIGVGVAILGLYDDFMTWKEGGDSLIDWTKWEPAINLLIAAIDTIKASLRSLIEGVMELINAFAKLFMGDVSGFFDSWNAAGEKFLNTLKSTWETVKNLGGMFASAGSAVLDTLGFSTPNISPSAQSALNSNQSIDQNTTIQIMGSDNPQATAKAVATEQNQVNANMARNFKGAVQ